MLTTTYSSKASFPGTRLRRLRGAPWIRDLVAETHVTASDFVLPLFVRDEAVGPDINAMPGVKRYTLQELPAVIDDVLASGLKAVALFPVIETHKRCDQALEALNPATVLLKSIALIKAQAPDLGVITDPALDAYTHHGHDGLLGDRQDVDNDLTLDMLAKHALCQVQVGADMVAPSDMMDGRVAYIRQVLDAATYAHIPILSYTAKYNSAFYGPFRQALQSARCLKGDKKTYHMDKRNAEEALREGQQDVNEHADMLLVKPGLMYLDIVWRLKATFHKPVFVYHVSGEYAMLKAAAEKGWLDYDQALMESLIAFKRAGASGIFTYGALEAARLIKETYGV